MLIILAINWNPVELCYGIDDSSLEILFDFYFLVKKISLMVCIIVLRAYEMQ